MDQTIYKLLLWALPVLLAVLGFIGALAVNALMRMASDIGEIKQQLATHSEKHEDHNRRIERMEDIVLKPKKA